MATCCLLSSERPEDHAMLSAGKTWDNVSVAHTVQVFTFYAVFMCTYIRTYIRTAPQAYSDCLNCHQCGGGSAKVRRTPCTHNPIGCSLTNINCLVHTAGLQVEHFSIKQLAAMYGVLLCQRVQTALMASILGGMW